jgi:hypothetical protein
MASNSGYTTAKMSAAFSLSALAVVALCSPAVAQAIGAGTICAKQDGRCPQEQPAMERETTYKGLRIRIVTQRAANGEWRARAELPGAAMVGGMPVKTARDVYATEQEAYTAALSATTAEVDRARARIGKP